MNANTARYTLTFSKQCVDPGSSTKRRIASQLVSSVAAVEIRKDWVWEVKFYAVL